MVPAVLSRNSSVRRGGWPWVKAAAVLAMSAFHGWLAARRKDFVQGTNSVSGRSYRIMNEVPTLLMIIIVISVIVKY